MNNFLLYPALARLLFWAAACACGVAHVAILRSVAKTPRHRRTELAWAVIPAIVLAGVLVMTWRAMSVGA
jgi:heme/copper-type cytochrome/quinol oxidase subunit 2